MKLQDGHKKILKLLQEGDYCVPKVNAIAKKLKMPATTVQSRVNRMLKEGVLTGCYGQVDPKKVDRKLTIFAVVKVFYPEKYSSEKVIDEFASKLAKIPEIQGVYTCSGDWDYLIKLQVRDTEHYNEVSNKKVLPLGGIEKLKSIIVYESFKDTGKIEF